MFTARLFRPVAGLAVLLGAGGCSSVAPLATVDYVDLDRFMGDWYVIANIPTFIEKQAYNAVESYSLADETTIDTTFTFRKGGFDGPEKRYNPTGFVRDTESNAIWGMQFIWPIRADYRVIYLDDTYQTTIIGRNKRDYLWIMARDPEIPDSLLQELIEYSGSVGYDTTQIRRVPQQW